MKKTKTKKSKKFCQKSNVTSSSKELTQLKTNTIRKFAELSDRLKTGELTFSYGGRPIRALPADVVRVVSQTPTKDEKSLLYRNILLNSILSSEKKSPYSGVLLLDMLKSRSSKNITVKTRVQKEDVLHLIRKNIGQGICYQITKEILKNCGPSPDLSFKLDNCQEFKLSINEFHNVPGRVHEIFTEKVTNLENCRLLVVDGTIEKVSELHQLLESASCESKGVVIASKNFFPDVSHTLSENYKTGKLKVVPFQISPEVDIEELESLGITCVRIENYRSLSLLTLEDLKEDHNISFNENKMKITGLFEKSLSRNCNITIPKRYQNTLQTLPKIPPERSKDSKQ